MTLGKAKGVDVTVIKVTTPKGIKYGPQAKSGETLVIVGYRLKNTADKPLSLLERPAFALIDAQGQRYNPDDFITASAGVEVAAQNSFVADINPNTSIDGRVAWKLDATAFDRNTWKLVVAGDPQLTFALK
ncbi:DUF4352 domain-containing protein [Sphingomonas sp. TZW2008]|uniref:DUF4352 domain-containing protein n=1 Tax=Sphingomonas sp. TZW2008 TaxID=1917973 RepID=UPI00211A8D00|nr:DUF4352 domain-containing protein [Sphingomonas sp. TZW2008]